MVAFKLLLTAAVCGIVTAWPEPTELANLNDRAIYCSKLTGCYGVLKKIGPPATAFCQSYLKVPGTKTTTTTVTPAAVTSTSTTTITTTVLGGGQCGQRHKRNAPDHAEPQHLDKRTNVLPLLAAFAAAKISEGCRCLHLQPTATKTATFTAPAPTVVVTETAHECVEQIGPMCLGIDVPCDPADPGRCCSGSCYNSRNVGGYICVDK